ncbi:MAG: lasso RiPP family leader peptide-containing protein [Gemmatimonadaceae bacterium]
MHDGRGGRTSAGRAARPHDTGRRRVYQKPKVERFGTFRELTQIGLQGSSDGFTICGIGGTGNNFCGTPDNPCPRTGS